MPKNNHPNRRAVRRKVDPKPEDIAKARIDANLSQEEAAGLVYSGLKTWQNWEAPKSSPSHRRMHPAIWELFKIKVQEKSEEAA